MPFTDNSTTTEVLSANLYVSSIFLLDNFHRLFINRYVNKDKREREGEFILMIDFSDATSRTSKTAEPEWTLKPIEVPEDMSKHRPPWKTDDETIKS